MLNDDNADQQRPSLITAKGVLIVQCMHPDPEDGWKALRPTMTDGGMIEFAKVPGYLCHLAVIYREGGHVRDAAMYESAARWAEAVLWYAQQVRSKPKLLIVR